MNSPDAGSPISSSTSSSPPPEEINASATNTSNNSYLTNLGNQIGAALSNATSSTSKRRLPSGSSFAGGSTRDTKSRRRGDTNRPWEGAIVKETSTTSGKKDKDDLVDSFLVELLRKEIGDPFSEVPFKG